MAQNRNYLVQKITEHYNRNNKAHIQRARAYGKESTLTLEYILKVTEVFDWSCPFCKQPLENTELCFNHFDSGIQNSGNTNFSVVLSCYKCNSTLYKKFRDNVDDFLDSLGQGRKADFYARLLEVAHLPIELPELEPVVQNALLVFCQNLMEKAANNV